MRKDRSSIPSGKEPDRHLPRERILRGKKQFQRLFSPRARQLRERSVDLRFYTLPGDPPEYRMAFIVSRKLGKAVRRNRTRRVMKEAFRKHQYLLAGLVESEQCTVHAALMAKSADIPYDDAERDVIALLTGLSSLKFSDTGKES